LRWDKERAARLRVELSPVRGHLPGDGAALEKAEALEIQSHADTQFLLFDLK